MPHGVLAQIAEAGLVKGERIGVDASTLEANAALRNIVRRATAEGYREMLERLAQESGIEAPTAENPAACVADKGYHSRAVLKALDDSLWKTRLAEPKQKGFSRWHGDEAAQRAVTNNRVRLKSGVAREAFKRRAEIVERSFAPNLDRGGMRRTWLRGRENVHKRYLLHVAGHNLSLLMRQLIGAGTPREAVAGGYGCIFVIIAPAGTILVAQILLIVSQEGKTAFAAIWIAVE